MSNYLKELELKKERKKALKCLVGKKALVLCSKKNKKITFFKCSTLELKEIAIKSIDDYCNIIALDENKDEITVSENIIDCSLILSLKHLRDSLKSLFIEREYIRVAEIRKDLKGQWCNNLNSGTNINLDTILSFNRKYPSEHKVSVTKLIPLLKTEVCQHESMLLCFNKEERSICLANIDISAKGICVNKPVKVKPKDFFKVESEESFKNGFYYGLNEIENIVDDVCDYYQDYFDYSEDYSVKKSIFKKGSKKIFSF